MAPLLFDGQADVGPFLGQVGEFAADIGQLGTVLSRLGPGSMLGHIHQFVPYPGSSWFDTVTGCEHGGVRRPGGCDVIDPSAGQLGRRTRLGDRP